MLICKNNSPKSAKEHPEALQKKGRCGIMIFTNEIGQAVREVMQSMTNKQKNAPIGVFDSGLGGISVLRELVKLMPGEDYLYFGDDVNAPYGNRSEADVLKLTESAVQQLLCNGCKAVVLACNTATAAAVVPLREKWKDQILVGAEPAIKPAIRDGHTVLGVLATATTLSSRRFHNLARTVGKDANIIPIPAPGLVELIEAQEWSGEKVEAFLENLLREPLQSGVRALVLGCTHYPFAAGAIRKVSGGLPLYDGNRGIALRTQELLRREDLLQNCTREGQVTFLHCGQSNHFFKLAELLLSANPTEAK